MSVDRRSELENLLSGLEINKENKKLKFYRPFDDEDTLWEVSNSQLEFHLSPFKKRWVFGGNRSGKTACGAAEAVYYALGEDGEEYWSFLPDELSEKYANIDTPNEGWVVASDHNVQVEASQKWIMKLIPDEFLNPENIRTKRNKILEGVKLNNGSDITFKSSAGGSSSFEGAAKRWIWFDEEPEYESVYNECLMRESGTFPLDLWGTMTPVKGLTWTHERIFEKQRTNDSLKVFNWTTYDNPYLPDSVKDNLEQEYKNEPKELERRLFGAFTGKSGMVYKMWDEEIHVIDPFVVPSHWDIYEIIDLGYENPSAVLYIALNPKGKSFVIDEIYQSGLTISQLADEIKEKREEAEFYEKDYYDPRLTLIDPSAESRNQPLDDRGKISENEKMTPRRKLRNNGIFTKQANNAKRTGIENVRDMLRDTDNGPDLVSFSTCDNFIYEIENYRLKSYNSEKVKQRKNSPEEARKKDDHLMDDLRYYANEGVSYVGPQTTSTYGGKNKTDSQSVTGY